MIKHTVEQLPPYIRVLKRHIEKAEEMNHPAVWKLRLDLKRARGRLHYLKAQKRRNDGNPSPSH